MDKSEKPKKAKTDVAVKRSRVSKKKVAKPEETEILYHIPEGVEVVYEEDQKKALEAKVSESEIEIQPVQNVSSILHSLPSIPLANEDPQEKVILAEPEIIEKKVYVVPEPITRHELNKARVEKIAERQTLRSDSRMKAAMDTVAQTKLDKGVRKTIEETQDYHDEKLRMCQKLNSYRIKYSAQFEFNWKKDYNPDLDITLLESHVHQVELILNTRHLPALLKGALNQMTEVFELISLAVNYPYCNLRGATEAVTTVSDSGYFDEELDQISIQFADWLAQPPLTRLALKWGTICLKQVGKNAPSIIKTSATNLQPTASKYNDL